MGTPSDRGKAIENALMQIERQFGKGSIMRLGSKDALSIESIPTGCLSLDAALGVGGVPRGRIIEIYGPEASGKTTLALHIVGRPRKPAGWRLSSTRSMLWIRVTPATWEWTWTTF